MQIHALNNDKILISYTEKRLPMRYPLQQIAPAILLVGGYGNVQGMSIREAVALVDKPSGEIKEIPSFQNHFQDRFPNFCLIKVGCNRINITVTADVNTIYHLTGKAINCFTYIILLLTT